MRSLLFGALGVILGGCGTPADLAGTAAASIRIDSTTMTSDQMAQVRSDLDLLSTLNLSMSPEDAGLVGVNDGSSAETVRYLTARVKWILGPSFDDGTIQIAQTNYPFQPQVGLTGMIDNADTPTLTTIAVNYGSSYYKKGRTAGKLYAIPFEGRPIEVKSPRTGIIQLAGAHFSSGTDKFSSNSFALRYKRILTLLHEAKHSDGNGLTTALSHVDCPFSHPDVNLRGAVGACDACTNGPYAVASIYAKYIYDTCADCSAAEKEYLRIYQAAQARRVLTDIATFCDATPEGTL